MVRNAVRELLDDGRYLSRARELEAAFARRHGIAEIAALVDEVVEERRTAAVGLAERADAQRWRIRGSVDAPRC